MKEFAELWEKLERSHVEERKVDLLVSYLKGEKDQDVSSALHLLLGRKVKRFCSSLELKSWGAEAAGVPLWLVEDSCEATGDIAEAVAMLLSDGEGECPSLSELLKKLRELEKGPRRKDFVVSLWSKLSRTERYLLNKVMGGGIKPGIEYSTLLRATALAFGRSKLSVAMALATEWDPIAENIHNLLERCRTEIEEIAFCLASPLDHPLPLLGQPEDWQIEWHWNGKRVQLIKGKLHDLVWSRHGEVVIHSSLELVDVLHSVPAGTVLDGMLIESEMKGQALFMAIDIPMLRGEDLRQYALAVRREKLERCREIITSSHFDISPRLSVETWEEVERLRLSLIHI